MSLSNLTPTQRQKLELHDWVVFTNDSLTQNAVAERLAEKSEMLNIPTKDIFYDGKALTVFVINFATAEFLAKNRHKVPYDFTAYHRTSKKYPWAIWKEGIQIPTQRLRKLDHLFSFQKSTGKKIKATPSLQRLK